MLYDLDHLNAFVRLGIPYALSGVRASAHEAVKDVPASSRENTSIVAHKRDAIRRPSSGKEGQDIQDDIIVSWTGSGISISLPYHKQDVGFVKKLQGAYWHPKYLNWVCKPTVYNLEKIQKRWSLLSQEKYDEWCTKMRLLKSGYKLIIYRTPKHPGCICLEVVGYGADHQLITASMDTIYHKRDKCYTTALPWSEVEKISKTYSNVYGSLRQVSDAMIRMNYGYSTIKSYTSKLCSLMDYVSQTDISDITAAQVNDYIDKLLTMNLSYSTVNTVHSAIRLYHTKVMHVEAFELDQLERPRTKRSLPSILSEGEVMRIISAISNVKHLAIIYLLYGSGLRRGEVIALELCDLAWDRNQILIKRAKGQKDRIVPMSRHLKRVLMIYLDKAKPARYVFESHVLGKPYSASSISNLLKAAVKRVGMTKKVTPHMFRHAFATHLIDHGVALPKVQALLGHKDVKTTMIYTHFSMDNIQKVKSPLDRIMDERVTFDNGKV